MCVIYLPILNSHHELTWALGETVSKKSDVSTLIFDAITYDYINDFEEIILLLINQYFIHYTSIRGTQRYKISFSQKVGYNLVVE